MKIISPFRDFYDDAAASGGNESVEFVRRTEVVHIPEVQSVFEAHLLDAPYMRGGGACGWSATPIILAFAGKRYPVWRLEVAEFPEDESFAYTTEHIEAFLADHDNQYLEEVWPVHREKPSWRDPCFRAQTVGAYIHAHHGAELAFWLFAEMQACYGMADAPSVSTLRWRGPTLTRHPVLKSLEFFRVVEPGEAYDLIQQFQAQLTADTGPEEAIAGH